MCLQLESHVPNNEDIGRKNDIWPVNALELADVYVGEATGFNKEDEVTVTRFDNFRVFNKVD